MTTTISRVLAAVDFSTPARAAFDYALALSVRHHAELAVIHAVPKTDAFGWRSRERVALAADLRAKAERAGVVMTERTQQGDPAATILLHARALEADVIVMGTHRRRGVERLRTGSVAERVVAGAAVPVLLVPARRRAIDAAPLRHVAVAIDFDAASAKAIEHALTLSRDRITLLHVVPGFPAGVPPHLHRWGAAEYQDELVRDARRRLERAVRSSRHRADEVEARVRVGETAREISRYADAIEPDLLVVGAPRRGAVSRALFGTTVARLLRRTNVPLLAIPHAPVAASGKALASRQIAA